MKIYSSFKDYYDSGARYGVEPDIKYVRNTVFYPEHPEPVSVWSSGGYSAKHDFYRGVVGFCGREYPFMEVIPRFPLEAPPVFCYSLEQLKAYLVEHGYTFSIWHDMATSRLEKFFTPYVGDEPFHTYKCPVYVRGRDAVGKPYRGVTTNPQLRFHEFVRVKSPIEAFQEIQGYIGGVLGATMNPMVVTSDVDKAVAAGHDPKTSFRKPSGTKRGRPQWR